MTSLQSHIQNNQTVHLPGQTNAVDHRAVYVCELQHAANRCLRSLPPIQRVLFGP